jgi:hypothetical protein
MRGATMSRREFACAGEANEAAAGLSNDPFPARASAAPGARHSAADMIMEALLRECLRARSLDDLSYRSNAPLMAGDLANKVAG